MKVVKFIEVSVQAQKVVLHATDHSESGRHEWQLPFDPELQEITIAVSGPGKLNVIQLKPFKGSNHIAILALKK